MSAHATPRVVFSSQKVYGSRSEKGLADSNEVTDQIDADTGRAVAPIHRKRDVPGPCRGNRVNAGCQCEN